MVACSSLRVQLFFVMYMEFLVQIFVGGSKNYFFLWELGVLYLSLGVYVCEVVLQDIFVRCRVFVLSIFQLRVYLFIRYDYDFIVLMKKVRLSYGNLFEMM